MTVLRGVVFPLILLKFCLTFQASQSQQQNLCVQSTSNSTPSLECNTLDWYSDNSAATFISNRKLFFQEGTHSLKKFLHIVNCHNLTITGSGNALHHSDGLPLPTSIIKCYREYDGGFLISNSSIVYLLTVLNVTVTEGTVNRLMFYVTFPFTCRNYFFLSNSLSHVQNRFSKVLWVFIAWLNLDSGFDACAYNGMTGYQYIWLTFGFVFYLFFIQAVMIILSHKFIFLQGYLEETF